MTRHIMTEEDCELVREMTEKGKTGMEIALMIGVSDQTIFRTRRRMGIDMPTVRHFTEEERDRVRRLRQEGMPASWIAEDLGCSISAIHDIVHANPDEVLAWRQSWARIRRDPALYALHREFAPKLKVSA